MLTSPTVVNILPGAPPVNGSFDIAVFNFTATAAGLMNLVISDDGGYRPAGSTTLPPTFFVSYANASIDVATVRRSGAGGCVALHECAGQHRGSQAPAPAVSLAE